MRLVPQPQQLRLRATDHCCTATVTWAAVQTDSHAMRRSSGMSLAAATVGLERIIMRSFQCKTWKLYAKRFGPPWASPLYDDHILTHAAAPCNGGFWAFCCAFMAFKVWY